MENLIKHGHRTNRIPCEGCGATDLYKAHDLNGRRNSSNFCDVHGSANWCFMNQDGNVHDCQQTGEAVSKPKAVAVADVMTVPATAPKRATLAHSELETVVSWLLAAMPAEMNDRFMAELPQHYGRLFPDVSAEVIADAVVQRLLAA